MKQQEINSLIEKYKEGIASPVEIDALHNWYREMGYANGLYPDEDVLVKARILNRLIATINPVKQQKLWSGVLRITGVAAAVAAITLGVWFFYTGNPIINRNSQIVTQNDIKPGKNTATLTIANGETINLSDSKTGVVIGQDKLAYNDGTDISGRHPEFSSGSRNGKATILTASTPRGGTYQVTLSDGTRVWLNADSKISFPSQFSGKQRKILFSGEAYFEVAKNKRMPFIVESNGQQTEVLGTHFNINAYKDEAGIKTTLLEGSVRVAFLSPSGRDVGTTERVLKPNQQSILTGSNRIEVKEVDAAQAVAWKNGFFQFEDASVETVLRQLSRWYDVEVVYNGPMLERRFTGKIYRNITAAEALRILKFTNVNFKIEGKRIIVTP